jgi:hypothetical protein
MPFADANVHFVPRFRAFLCQANQSSASKTPFDTEFLD